MIQLPEFYVLLTLHLGTFLVNNQLDAQFFFLMFIPLLYMVRTRSGSFCLTCLLDGHLHRETYTRRCIDTIDSPDDEHEFARNL
jgi:hypothetical protein